MINGGIAIIGGGNMGGALARGLVAGGLAAADLTIVEVDASKRTALAAQFPGSTIAGEVVGCANAVIAVKPADAAAATRATVDAGATTVLSIAAGVTLAKLTAAAGHGVAVIRAMPNTPALVGKGASGFALGEGCGAEAEAFAAEVLGSVGLALRVDESLLDAVTGLTGSGPAYLFYVAEAMIAAGVAEGLAAETAEALVRQLFLGAGTLLAESPDSPTRLRENVTSPNGTTAAGLAALSAAGGREAFFAAVRAATARSIELGS
ncbi:MAG: pyrroline-5-carboxylate reductase [Actinomycetota bacterium]